MQGWLKDSHNLLYKIVLWLVFWFFKAIYRHKIYGIANFCSEGALLAANHASFYDPPLVSISTPYEVHFLARKTLFNFPIFGSFIRKLNAHPVSGKAQDVAVFKTIVRLVKEGKKVIIFPEGTRSFDGNVRAMKPGISLLIARSNAAVIPVYIHGAFSIWPRSKKLPKFTGRTACIFGKPLRFSKEASQEEISNSIYQAISSLKAWYEAGAHGEPT
jgi:1-acyl-sn-glycerol-3-phosphate acyltransferase